MTQSEALASLEGRLTAAAFSVFAFWGWFNYCFAPIVPLMRLEMGTSRSVAGLLGTALAVGTLAAGSIVRRSAGRLGRLNSILLGVALVMLGVLAISLTDEILVCLAGALAAGFGGALATNLTNAVITEHHGKKSPVVISRGNAVASLCGIAAPLALGASVSSGLGWRVALSVALPLGVVTVALLWRGRLTPAMSHRALRLNSMSAPTAPIAEPGNLATAARMPALFWRTLVVMTLIVGIEVSVTFWGTDYMSLVVGLTKGEASSTLSALLIGMMIGRAFGAPLTTRFAGDRVLLIAFAVSIVGWLGFWSAASLVMAFASLLVLGMGLALQFPVIMVKLFAAARGQTDAAAGWVSVSLAIGVGCVPILDGWLSDHLGSRIAFLVIPVLALIAVLLLVGDQRSGASGSDGSDEAGLG